MSLIADALRKAESASGQAANPPSPKSLWGYRALLAGCVGGILLGVGILARRHTPSSTPLPPTSGQTVKAEKPRGFELLRAANREMSLNGIVRGGDGKSLALINNQVVEEGSTVQGVKLVSIRQDGVELQDTEGRTQTLRLAD